MTDYTSSELDSYLCENGYCHDDYFVELSTANNQLRPTCRMCPTVTQTGDNNIYTITGGDIDYNSDGIALSDFRNTDKYLNLRQCSDSFFVSTTKNELYGTESTSNPQSLAQELSGISPKNKPDFCEDVANGQEFENTQINEFVDCVSNQLTINIIRSRLKSYTRYSEITEIDIQGMHNMLNILMNLKVSDIEDCSKILTDPDECRLGFTEPLLALVYEISELVKSFYLEIITENDRYMKSRLQEEFKTKLPLTVKHLIILARDYEMSFTSGCSDVSDNTEYIYSLHKSNVITLDIQPILKLLGALCVAYVIYKLVTRSSGKYVPFHMY